MSVLLENAVLSCVKDLDEGYSYGYLAFTKLHGLSNHTISWQPDTWQEATHINQQLIFDIKLSTPGNLVGKEVTNLIFIPMDLFDSGQVDEVVFKLHIDNLYQSGKDKTRDVSNASTTIKGKDGVPFLA